MEKYYFKTDDLCVGYNGNALINNINIELQKGQILTLIGPNGSGKSTILKSITNHLKRIAGTVLVGEDSLDKMDYKELATKMAVVLTDRMKPELMTCRDIVASGRYPYTGRLGFLTEEDNKKIDEAMELVNATELANRDFTATSDGQKQRVLLARAICQEPDIIVLDEPTSFLDIKHKLELLDILRRMAKEQNVVVVMSLHEIDLAQKVSDIVMCVKGDVISRCGAPEEIFKKDIITQLYDIEKGNYNMHFGSVELPAPTGDVDTFVICGNGTGVEVFRDLQKKGIPFYTGVLHENDVDCQVARDLSTEVVIEEAFECISDKNFEVAKALLEKCSNVIYTNVKFASMNKKNEELLNHAKQLQKSIQYVSN